MNCPKCGAFPYGDGWLCGSFPFVGKMEEVIHQSDKCQVAELEARVNMLSHEYRRLWLASTPDTLGIARDNRWVEEVSKVADKVFNLNGCCHWEVVCQSITELGQQLASLRADMRFVIEREETPSEGRSGASAYFYVHDIFCENAHNGHKYASEEEASKDIKALVRSDWIHKREGYKYHVIGILYIDDAALKGGGT